MLVRDGEAHRLNKVQGSTGHRTGSCNISGILGNLWFYQYNFQLFHQRQNPSFLQKKLPPVVYLQRTVESYFQFRRRGGSLYESEICCTGRWRWNSRWNGLLFAFQSHIPSEA
jgi:hypothetical protein